MNFLAPWALGIAGIASAGMVLLHLVARQRPAAFMLPTTRFIPDRRTLVSRAATRPRDLVLLALRVLLLLAAGAAFARPVLTPARGTIARVILLDRSRAVANPNEALARARALAQPNTPSTIITFDSAPVAIRAGALDSLANVPQSASDGSLGAALIAARRAAVSLAQRADSVQLVIVSPFAEREFDLATVRLRDEWPGAVHIDRVGVNAGTAGTWRLEHPLLAEDALGPAVTAMTPVPGARVTRLVRGVASAADTAFARDGGIVVIWPPAPAVHASADGLSADGDVIVAALGRSAIPPPGVARARWADGSVAASESRVGKGCVRVVGIALPAAGDIALHPPFQRVVRTLLRPCDLATTNAGVDSLSLARFVGTIRHAAPASQLRANTDQDTPLTRWLIALAFALALAEFFVRWRTVPQPA